MTDALGERESEPQALAIGAIAEARIRLEDSGLFLPRDARPGVGHPQLQLRVVAGPPHRAQDRADAAPIGIFDGVAH